MPMQTYTAMPSMPPRHVYSANVENKAGAPIVATAVYQVPPDGHNESLSMDVAPNCIAHFPEKLVTEGTMTSVGHIEQVHVADKANPTVRASLVAPHAVKSPTKDYLFVVRMKPTGFEIEQPLRTMN